MKFINDNPHRKFRCISDRLWIYGNLNINDNILLYILDEKGDFSHIRGQFAFVYINKDRWIGCVDHIASTQLFYSKGFISPSLRDVKKNCKVTINEFTRNCRLIMGEYVPGTITPYNEITRLRQECYVKNGTQWPYMDICNEPTRKFDVDEAYELIKIASNREPSHTLLMSGGKDSAFLGMLSKHLEHKCRMVHIASMKNSKHSVDEAQCRLFKEEMKWRILRYPIEHSGPQNAEDKELYCRKDWWHDNTHPVKSLCGQNWNNIKVTGEVSVADQQRSTYASYLVNMGDRATAHDVVMIHLRGCITNNNKAIPFSATDQIFAEFKKKYLEEFQYLYIHFLDKLNSIDKDPIYAYYIFRNQMVQTHRLYGQSQDPNCSWYAPFADYDVYNLLLNIEWDARGNKIQKKPLYDIAKAKFGKHFTDIPWRFPIMGMGIRT